MGVVTYEADPGRLSAAFVWDLLRRVTALPATVRYVTGGWAAVIERMRVRARDLGVRVETGVRMDRLPAPPVIVATQLESAAKLLGDHELRWESSRCVLLDLGLERRLGDPYLLFDLDEAGVLERLSAPDPSLAPSRHSLVQAMMPLLPGEPTASGVARLEQLLDVAFADWRQRTAWRRSGVAAGRSGALDLPGRTWRDRPAVERGNGVFLAGDMVAAPGMRGEIAINSALRAAAGALRVTPGLRRAPAVSVPAGHARADRGR